MSIGRKTEEVLSCEAAFRLQAMEEAYRQLLRLPEPGKTRERKLSEKERTYVLLTLKENICRKCPKYRECFGKKKERTEEEIFYMLGHAMKRNGMDGTAAPEEFRKRCIYFQPFLGEMSWLFYVIYQNQSWESRMEELRRIMKKQAELQYLFLRECRKSLSPGSMLPGPEQRRLKRKLLRRGLRLVEGRKLTEESGIFQISLLVQPVWPGENPAAVGRILSELYGKAMIPNTGEFRRQSGMLRMVFAEEGKFHVLFGCCRKKKEGEAVCGDTFSLFKDGQRRAVMLLSDGMGAGKRAFEESRQLMEAYEGMLSAGLGEEYAMEMLHGTLLGRKDSFFSTMDAVVISLQTGRVKSLKAGGSATFLLHGNSVERLRPAGLPPGSLSEQKFDSCSRKLYDGDMVIMLSDGMLDFEAAADRTFCMEHILSRIQTKNAQSFAEQLMALLPQPPEGHGDDKTVLVAALWEKKRST